MSDCWDEELLQLGFGELRLDDRGLVELIADELYNPAVSHLPSFSEAEISELVFLCQLRCPLDHLHHLALTPRKAPICFAKSITVFFGAVK